MTRGNFESVYYGFRNIFPDENFESFPLEICLAVLKFDGNFVKTELKNLRIYVRISQYLK